MKRVGLLLAFALFLTPALEAAPNQQGETGLIRTPTADVLPDGGIGVAYFHRDGQDIGALTITPSSRLEIGAANFKTNGSNKTLLNAKYNVVPEGILTPGVSIGVEDLTAQNERTAYAAVSKTLPLGLRLHAGVGNGRIDGTFVGASWTFNPIGITGSNAFPATTIMTEYDGHDWNYGAQLALLPGLKAQAGRSSDKSYYGVTWTF